jgi:nucleoside-diphosphate-sugar epimerase
MKKRTSVVVTGANGFTGSHLIKSSTSRDWEWVPLVHRGSGLEGEIIADFCSEEFSGTLRGIQNVDAVVHLGARVGWEGSSKEDLYVPNVLATAELVNWAKKKGAYFLFASAALIGGEKETRITKETPDSPMGDYLYSKFLAEEIIKFSGIQCSILRIAGIFGRNGPEHLGLNRAIHNALNGKAPVRYGKGLARRNYIYVEDLCDVIRFCIKNRVVGTHLVAGAQVNTVREMLDAICRVFLPGREPDVRSGAAGFDQVVEPSAHLPLGRSFIDALHHIGQSQTG